MTDFNREIDELIDRDNRTVIYFARPQSCYAMNGSTLDGVCIQLMERLGFNVVDPGSTEVAELFEKYRSENPDNYMQFFKMICDKCDAVAMMPFPDDQQAEGVPNRPLRIGAGVWFEAKTFFDRGAPVYLMVNDGTRALMKQKFSFYQLYQLDRDQTIRLLALTMPLYRQKVEAMDKINPPPNCS